MRTNIYTIIGTDTYLGAHMMKLLNDKEQIVIGFSQDDQFVYEAEQVAISDLPKYKDFPSVDGEWIIICLDSNMGFQKYSSKMSNICDILRNKEFVGDICFFSSSSVCMPDFDQSITEATAATCRTDSDLTLVCGENLLSVLACSDKGYAVPHVMRIGIPYGNEAAFEITDGFINKMIFDAKNKVSLKIPLGGDAKRSITHISDICDAAFQLMMIEDGPMTINIPGEVKSIREVGGAIAQKYNVDFTQRGLCRSVDKDFFCGDQILSDDLFKETIHFNPRYQFDSWLSEK